MKIELEKKAKRMRESYEHRKVLFETSGAVEELTRLHESLADRHDGLLEED